MFNVVRMDLYQMLKGKSFKVFSLIMIVCAAALALTLWFVTTPAYESMFNEQMQSNNQGESQSGSLSFSVDASAFGDTKATEYQQVLDSLFSMTQLQAMENGLFSAGLLTMLILLFIGIMLTSEFSSGFIKNTLTTQTSRASYFAGRMITMFIAASILTALGVVTSLICFTLLGLDFVVSPVADIATWMGLVILLSMAMASLVALVSWLTQNKIAAVLAAIFVGSGMLMGILSVVLNVFPKAQELTDYTLFNSLVSLRTNIEASNLTQTLCVGLGFLALYATVGFIVLKKKDV